MPKREVLVVEGNDAWVHYLTEAFEDTISNPRFLRTAAEGLTAIQKGRPDLVFAASELLTRPVVAALQMHRSSNGNFRAFRLGSPLAKISGYPFEDGFDEIPPLTEFHRRLVQHLPLPDPIRILVVDDEPGVRQMFVDYFDGRTGPRFMVETAENGARGEERIRRERPEVLILDIKMPEKDGRELYRDLKKEGILPPTIIFFDIVSAEEVLEIQRWGRPAFVEKGSGSSAMPEMAALIKKLAYFG